MPKFDGTGPAGAGPRTGRGMGPCCGGYGWGRGTGAGFGMGYGRRSRFSNDEQKEMLKAEIEDLKQELKLAEEELAQLEK